MPDAPKPFHILVIDSSKELRTLFSELLMDEGYRVTTRRSLSGNLDGVDDLAPDLIILDSMWSQDDAPWSLLQLLRMHRGTTPIPLILCTTTEDEVAVMDDHLRAKSVQVVTKPI